MRAPDPSESIHPILGSQNCSDRQIKSEVLRFFPDFLELKPVASNADGDLTFADARGKARRVLLLQGPVGPFFPDLHTALAASGFSVRRVLLNAGDRLFASRLFASRQNCIRFTGTLSEWDTWLRFEIDRNTPDAIILFGSSRPAHEVARRIAGYFDVAVISLEEGYLRSGYVSCEIGGNNQHSPLAKWSPKHPLRKHPLSMAGSAAPAVGVLNASFATMSFWGATYYLVRDLAAKPSDANLFHRRRERAIPLAWSWGVHMLCRFGARITEFPVRRTLHRNPGYILIPLQVSSDSQLNAAARGWNTPRLIDGCLRALVAAGNRQRVVFKLHPLERRSAAIKRLILRKAKQHGVDRRSIKILHSGRIGTLTHHSSGMIVINSTCAFSALHHEVPVLVLGEAVLRHEEIVMVGDTEADIAAFFKLRRAKSRGLINAFLAELKSHSLIAGDFYIARGRKVAVAGVIGKLKQLHRASRLQKKANA